MAEQGYHKDRPAYQPNQPDPGMNINKPKISYNEAQTLCLNLPEIGIISIAEMSLHVSYRVYEALLAMCPPLTRNALMRDDGLYLSDPDAWWYILNEIVRAGVKLPVV